MTLHSRSRVDPLDLRRRPPRTSGRPLAERDLGQQSRIAFQPTVGVLGDLAAHLIGFYCAAPDEGLGDADDHLGQHRHHQRLFGDRLTELFALFRVSDGVVDGSLTDVYIDDIYLSK